MKKTLFCSGILLLFSATMALAQVKIPWQPGREFTFSTNFYVTAVGDTTSLTIAPENTSKYKFKTDPSATTLGLEIVTRSTSDSNDSYTLRIVDGSKQGSITVRGAIVPRPGGGGGGSPQETPFHVAMLQRLVSIFHTVPSGGTNLVAAAGSTNDLTAQVVLGNLQPAASGKVNWNAGSLGTFTANDVDLVSGSASTKFIASTGSVSGNITATGKNLKDLEGGTVPEVSTNLVVTVVKFELKEVTFSGSSFHAILQDNGSGAYPTPHWNTTTNYPVAYTRNTKLKATAKFQISPSSFTGNVKIKGDGPGSLDIPETTASPSGGFVTLPATEASGAFANTVDFLNKMVVNWKCSVDGGTTFCDAGASTNQVYVTLNNPTTANLFHTVVHLACANGHAVNSADATANTWALFAGPANVKTWDGGNLLRYYGGGFSGIPTDTAGLLQNGDGNCVAWMSLFMDSLAADGIASDRVWVRATGAGDSFLVKNWTYGTASYTNTPPYNWKLALPTAAYTMAPIPSGGVYGDLTSLATLHGQNTAPPSEKLFGNHRVARVGAVYYDPSYGVTYSDAADFQSKAVAGFAHDYGDSTSSSMILRIKQPTATVEIMLTLY